MIKSLHAENFRCFKSLDLGGLRRINVIVGRNASGKTALLETIKTGLDGTPNLIPWMNQLRSTPTFLLGNPTPEQFRALFVDLFYNFDADEKISVSLVDSKRRTTASVQIHFDEKQAVTTSQPSIGFRQQVQNLQQPITIIPLAFNRTDFNGQRATLLVTINAQGQPHIDQGKNLGIGSYLMANINYGTPGENAAWLSQLSVQKRSGEVIEAVQRHFPFIHGLSSESLMPGMPATLYADLPNLTRRIPISLVSGGISRLLTMVLSIMAYAGGVVLIDEVENGIFHDLHVPLWKTLLDLAKHYDTQLFVSTHSQECLRGAAQAIASDSENFTLLRTRIDSEGKASVEVFGGEQAEAAIEKNGEVRD
jgi:hypothetical protein